MGWINLLHAPNYQGVAPIYRAKVYFFLIFACVREIALECSSNFLAFFDKYSKNSPRKSKGSRNFIRAELRRLPIPTRNARPNLVVGTGVSGSQPLN